MQFVCAVSEIRWTGQTRKKIAVDCSVVGLRQSSHFLPLTSLPNIWSYKIWRCERVFRHQDKRNKDLRSEEWGLIVWSLAGVRQSRHFLLLTSSAACGCLATCLSSGHFILLSFSNSMSPCICLLAQWINVPCAVLIYLHISHFCLCWLRQL